MTNPPDWENDQISGTDQELMLEDQQELKKPRLYKVVLHNDDYTTMEFVVFVLQSVFKKSSSEAQLIMLSVHQQGAGIAGVYPYEIAEAKVDQVTRLARSREFPLLCTVEEE